MTATSETDEKITLTLLNGTGYVFRVDDYITLRRKHRIVGALVGTCSIRGWSANDCTLPLELTPHETRFLVERGIAQLVSKQESLLRVPEASELVQYHEQLEAGFTAQAETLKAQKLRETERNISNILAGKRKKLLREGVAEADIKLDAAQILQEIADNFVFDRKNAQLEIACAHPQPLVNKTVEPPSIENPLKYQVFSEFWTRGYYVTAGDSFGADFLLYPGDPLQYHASHIVVLLKTPVVEPLHLITKVRLSVIVNKICIFAYFVSEEEGDDAMDGAGSDRKVHYQTVRWEGNRDKLAAAAGSSGES
ncbi:tRNA-splicing endonuclease subunit Sen34-like isoform X2 [Rhagoletis pomonella]|uniref:tRNA-splicing endonuclease subunit Sen34-like isoform X2 n=1 Tax=Rhagoletis pomonella TaxID=28610 RepID=UPI001784BA83|nr:tRNA-splicing endonuclease subunit Sen34-like isoform X2 [Rhagoletis pomonella]